MAEARIRETETGRVAEDSGWFVLNLRDASWEQSEGYGVSCGLESADARFPHFGVNVTTLQPGEPKSLYHSEDTQEGFLVLAGECVAVIEGAERPLRQWDYFHSPPGTAHVLVGPAIDPAPCSRSALPAPGRSTRWNIPPIPSPATTVPRSRRRRAPRSARTPTARSDRRRRGHPGRL
jgi:mannose-6-phosphate isomerase-like protein (cupin superfamily)